MPLALDLWIIDIVDSCSTEEARLEENVLKQGKYSLLKCFPNTGKLLLVDGHGYLMKLNWRETQAQFVYLRIACKHNDVYERFGHFSWWRRLCF